MTRSTTDVGFAHVERRPGAYADSVALLQVSKDVAAVDGVRAAQVAMATPLNLDVIASMGFDLPETSPNDMVVAVRLDDESRLDAALAAVDTALVAVTRRDDSSGSVEEPPRTTGTAIKRSGTAMALISVPGANAAVEAMDALDAGQDVMIFSDNVPIEQEVALKRIAADRDLLVMGPDCGTAMVDGIGLGFANTVQPGPVGIVAASGTGCQQLMCLLDHAGVGMTAALGVGGRDLSIDVGALATRQALRKLDESSSEDLLSRVAGAIHRADDRIGELIEEDPNLNGTSTTATVPLFDGTRLGMGHLGDSRAYLLREGQLSQLTTDHTFVQTLIDDGRITEADSRTHPHRNLILKAVDGIRHEEPDLFEVPVQPGDRIMLCSDGVCGVLDAARLAAVLGSGNPDFAAVELVRASLEAGSTDNVTALVAEVREEPAPDDLQPLLVGAAADLPRRSPLTEAVGTLFRGHRSGDTGEIEPITDEDVPAGAFPSDPIDPETARYAPQAPRRYAWLSRLLVLAALVGIGWIGVAAAWSWSQQQFYVGEHDGNVTIFRGLNTDLPLVEVSHPFEETDVPVDNLSEIDAEQIREGIEASDIDDARLTVDNYAARQDVG